MNKPFSFAATSSGTTGGGLFGSSSATTAPTSQQQTSLFGFGNTTAPAANTSTTGTSGFSSSFSFNKPAATASPFSSSTTAQPASTLGTSFTGFGAKPATTGTSLFGASTGPTPAATTATTGFGGGGFGSFGSTNLNQTTGSFSTGLGSGIGGAGANLFGAAPKPQQTSFFSSGTSLGSTFGQGQANATLLGQTQPLAQPAAPAVQNEQDYLLNCLVNPQIFNDERDAILARWNQLQTFYGFGKMFYQNSTVEVNKENQLSRFKTIGFSCKPTNKNEDGLVCLIFNKKESDVKANQNNITDNLHKIFNSDPSLTVVIDSIKPTDDKTQVEFYVKQRMSQTTDQTTRVASLMVFNHLNKQETPANTVLGGLATKQTTKQQLEQIGVINMYPLVGLTDEEIKNYLDKPPVGLNPMLWDQAKKNNPNPKKLIPVQITGFQEINKRFKLQDQENNAHKATLNFLNESIESLNSRNKLLKSKIDQFKARNEDLEQRVLKVMINYEIRRKIGLPLQENEKYLLSILDSFQMELNSPINKEIQRQKLNEFVEIIKSYESSNRLQRGSNVLQSSNATNIDSIDVNNLSDVQNSLREQHKAFKSLIEIVNKDMKDLQKIKKNLGVEK